MPTMADQLGRPPTALSQEQPLERTEAETAEVVAKANALLAEDPDRLRVLGEWIDMFDFSKGFNIPHSASVFYNALRPLEPDGEPPMKLLKSSYVLEQATKMREAKQIREPQLRAEAVAKLAITYRQAMPPQAFMTPEEVEEQSKKINPFFRRLAAAGLSYCWESTEHPDPEGNSLIALANALEECWGRKKSFNSKGPYGHFPDEIGIFWDYPCLFQHPPGRKRTRDSEGSEAVDVRSESSGSKGRLVD